jgi:prepilin-type N-terminal cleavage/methylation domain-containing protein
MLRRTTRSAYTLIELLVVVFIIAILAGLLFAGVQKARDSAKKAACVNNLRQLGVAFYSYQSVKGGFPTEGSSSSGTSTYPSFYKSLLPYAEANNATDSTPVALYLCPGRRNMSVGAKRDYGYASSQGTGSVGPSILDNPRPVRLVEIDEGNRKAETVLLTHVWLAPSTYLGGDSTDLGWATKNNSRTTTNVTKQDGDSSGNNTYLGGPHGAGNLSLFADGHVENYIDSGTYAQLWAYAGPRTGSNPLLPNSSGPDGYVFDVGPTGSGYPQVTGVSPNSGPTIGGTIVTISGSGFSSATAVTFGGIPARSFTVASDSKIVAFAPAGSAGSVDVAVTNSMGMSTGSSSAQYTYVDGGSGPVVVSVSPGSGPSTGGTCVCIEGSGFDSVTQVYFGNTPAKSFVVLNGAVQTAFGLMAVAPPGIGTVDVTVVTSAGTSKTTSADQFRYITTKPGDTTLVSGVSPSSGPSSGGTMVTITGSGFTGTTGVSFGGTTATQFSVVSDTQLIAVVPASSAAGAVDITVTAAAGTSAASPADKYTFVDTGKGASVTGVSPSSGPDSGGTSVTITGSGFSSATAVNFGGTPGTQMKVISDTQITVTAPGGTAGSPVDVTVVTSAGTSVTSGADQYTYVPNGALDYAQMATDANTIAMLLNSPNPSATDLINALQIALKYQQYMAPTHADGTPTGAAEGWFQTWLNQLKTDQANGTYQYSNYTTNGYAGLGWNLVSALTLDVSPGLAQMSAAQNYVPGEVFIDPDYATGYDYSSSINFKSVLVPKPLPGGQKNFELVVGDKTFPLEAGKRFWFTEQGYPTGVPAFTIRGIDLSEQLDATNMAAFMTGITFIQEGNPRVRMVPIVKKSASPWTLAFSAIGVLLLGTCCVSGWTLMRRRKKTKLAVGRKSMVVVGRISNPSGLKADGLEITPAVGP